MLRLRDTSPDVYEAFMSGFHTIRRSERYWEGLSTDLVIEQVLMRSLKSTGGLTRGRGITENQRSMWLFPMPICVQMNNAMQEFTGTSFQTSDQHKETGNSRSVRDSKDMNTLLTFLRERIPFNKADRNLRNIETCVEADPSVNVYNPEELGESIVKNMNGQTAARFSLKRSMQFVTMSEKNDIKIQGEAVHFDTQLLFQRLTAVEDSYIENVPEVFQYELASIPSSLSDTTGLPREPHKATLADALWRLGDHSCLSTKKKHGKCTHFVIDGGSLLQRITWNKGKTYGEICKCYSDYLCRNFISEDDAAASNVTIVFDGYSQRPNTKDVTHYRRLKGRACAQVRFSIETPCRMSNEINKQNFIYMLGECLMRDGFSVCHAIDDADVLIVQTAITLAETHNVNVIGEYTDLLVLLCHYFRNDLNDVVFRSASKKISENGKVWDIRKAKLVFGSDICVFPPLLHAFTGCDTTSRIFGIGKSANLKLSNKSPVFRTNCNDFLRLTYNRVLVNNFAFN